MGGRRGWASRSSRLRLQPTPRRRGLIAHGGGRPGGRRGDVSGRRRRGWRGRRGEASGEGTGQEGEELPLLGEHGLSLAHFSGFHQEVEDGRETWRCGGGGAGGGSGGGAGPVGLVGLGLAAGVCAAPLRLIVRLCGAGGGYDIVLGCLPGFGAFCPDEPREVGEGGAAGLCRGSEGGDGLLRRCLACRGLPENLKGLLG